MFGGISTSICTWSGHISASTILTPFLLHSMLKIFAMSWRNAPYATFLRNFGANTIWYLQFHLGQFTRNYTQTTKRGLLTTNKGWISSTGKVRNIQPVLLSGVSKGGNAPIWHTTLLAKCSVLYALSALLRKWGCRRGGQGHLKRQENRAVIAWRGAASAGLVSSADRAYMNAPVPRLTLDYGTKCPRRIATLTKDRKSVV